MNARFPGLYIPIINWYFNGPMPTDTQFPATVVMQRWDGFTDSRSSR